MVNIKHEEKWVSGKAVKIAVKIGIPTHGKLGRGIH